MREPHPAEKRRFVTGHDFSRASMGLRRTQMNENTSAASAPEGRHENSPGRQPWVGRREEALSPGGAAEISSKILKGIERVFDRAARATKVDWTLAPAVLFSVIYNSAAAKAGILSGHLRHD